jgi:hypothetical protein
MANSMYDYVAERWRKMYKGELKEELREKAD